MSFYKLQHLYSCRILCHVLQRSNLNFLLYSKMNLKLLIHLIFLCVLNTIFFFSGVVLNTLVIITIFNTPQLRKKLCHFMIMVLSCCDLLTVMTYSSVMIVYLIIWLTENNELYNKGGIYWHFCNLSGGLSLLSLMVMCIERYLAVYYPIFHKTSVTRRRLLTLLAIFIILTTTLIIISTNDMVISFEVALSTFLAIFIPAFIFFNYKLFKISRKMRRQNAISPEKRRKIHLKNINTCLLAVASLVFLSIPTSVYVVFRLLEGSTSDNTGLSATWSATTIVMNCSLNSLIFFWKNKVLRDEGIKIIKKIKDRVLGS